MTESLYLVDILEQWFKNDPDMSNWSVSYTNRPWLACSCTFHVSITPPNNATSFPCFCVWADCVQVIVVSGYKSYDIRPENPEFFSQLKTALLKDCK